MFTSPLAFLMATLLELEGVGHLHRNNRATKAAARARSVTPPKRGVIQADIRLEKGHILGLVGPNGAGKSTLMSVLAGILPPQRGILRVNGKPIKTDKNRLSHREMVGFMPERVGWSGPGTPRDVLQRLCVVRGLNRSVAMNLLEIVGLRSRANDRLSGLSQGMRQRLSLAAALMGEPQILLLDEPMNGLDPVAQAAFREMIRLRADSGATMVISSHRLNELERFVDRVAIMHNGRIITRGSFSSIEHDLGVGHRLLISGLGSNPKDLFDDNPLIEVEDLEGEPDWTLRLTRHEQSWSTDLRAELVDRIVKNGSRLTLMEIVPPNLEEILSSATGLERDLALQEESE